jgi:transposase
MRQSYPSDISRAQFEKIRPILESARKITKPRKIDLYDIYCAILYILKSGCQWNMLPKDFPKYKTCHYYFRIWRERKYENTETILELILKKSSWRGPKKPWSRREN